VFLLFTSQCLMMDTTHKAMLAAAFYCSHPFPLPLWLKLESNFIRSLKFYQVKFMLWSLYIWVICYAYRLFHWISRIRSIGILVLIFISVVCDLSIVPFTTYFNWICIIDSWVLAAQTLNWSNFRNFSQMNIKVFGNNWLPICYTTLESKFLSSFLSSNQSCIPHPNRNNVLQTFCTWICDWPLSSFLCRLKVKDVFILCKCLILVSFF
jgi:hypothetical protein